MNYKSTNNAVNIQGNRGAEAAVLVGGILFSIVFCGAFMLSAIKAGDANANRRLNAFLRTHPTEQAQLQANISSCEKGQRGMIPSPQCPTYERWLLAKTLGLSRK